MSNKTDLNGLVTKVIQHLNGQNKIKSLFCMYVNLYYFVIEYSIVTRQNMHVYLISDHKTQLTILWYDKFMVKLTILCYDQILTSQQSNGMAAIPKSLSIAKPILCHYWQCYHCLVIW